MADPVIITGRPPKQQIVDPNYYTGLGVPLHDYISGAYPDDTTEVYTFRIGGASGEVQAIITVVYTDNTKALIDTVSRTPQFGV